MSGFGWTKRGLPPLAVAVVVAGTVRDLLPDVGA